MTTLIIENPKESITYKNLEYFNVSKKLRHSNINKLLKNLNTL